MAASFGYIIGLAFAAIGVGYAWLGFLMLIRVRKHWPRASAWSAVAVTALIGSLTALNEPAIPLLPWVGTAAAIAFMLWRSRSSVYGSSPTA
jgi:hypothetical protein